MADNNATTPVPPPAAAGTESPVEKSKNADKNEAKRLAKMEKFLAKQKVRSFKCKGPVLPCKPLPPTFLLVVRITFQAWTGSRNNSKKTILNCFV